MFLDEISELKSAFSIRRVRRNPILCGCQARGSGSYDRNTFDNIGLLLRHGGIGMVEKEMSLRAGGARDWVK